MSVCECGCPIAEIIDMDKIVMFLKCEDCGLVREELI